MVPKLGRWMMRVMIWGAEQRPESLHSHWLARGDSLANRGFV